VSNIPAKVLPLTIPLSGSVSSAVNLGAGRGASFVLPTITSAQAFLALSPTINSADFVRMVDSSGTVVWAVGAGSCVMDVSRHIGGAGYCRLELSNPQSAVRSLSCIIKT